MGDISQLYLSNVKVTVHSHLYFFFASNVGFTLSVSDELEREVCLC